MTVAIRPWRHYSFFSYAAFNAIHSHGLFSLVLLDCSKLVDHPLRKRNLDMVHA